MRIEDGGLEGKMFEVVGFREEEGMGKGVEGGEVRKLEKLKIKGMIGE
ncbi:hypothetical protein [Staphylococcus auricularis]|nr:hypothetical protein [Staphylococcus auricularis]